MQLAAHLSHGVVFRPRAGEVDLSTVRRRREREVAPAAPAGGRLAVGAGTHPVSFLRAMQCYDMLYASPSRAELRPLLLLSETSAFR